jgi:hypothetical protein
MTRKFAPSIFPLYPKFYIETTKIHIDFQIIGMKKAPYLRYIVKMLSKQYIYILNNIYFIQNHKFKLLLTNLAWFMPIITL